MSRLKLIKEFIKSPGEIGTICPSSAELAEEITSGIGIEKALSIAELGPGTAVFTPHIMKKKKQDATYFAVELNQSLCVNFKNMFPHLNIHNKCASELPDIMKTEGAKHLDVIVSGLPWASFPADLQNRLMAAILLALHEGGTFTTYGYFTSLCMPGAMHFKKLLKKNFRTVKTSRVVWRNIPPAFTYRCSK